MRLEHYAAFEKEIHKTSFSHFFYLIVTRNAQEAALLAQDLCEKKGAWRRISSLLETCAFEKELRKLADPELFDRASKQTLVVEGSEKLRRPILQFLQKLAQVKQGVFVLTACTVKTTDALYQIADSCGLVFDLRREKPWEMKERYIRFMHAYCQARRFSLHQDAAEALHHKLGCDRLLLEQELFKLWCYAGNRPEISLSDVKALVCATVAGTPWIWSSSILRRDLYASLQALKESWESQNTAPGMLAVLRLQFQTAYRMQQMHAAGCSLLDLQNALPQFRYGGRALNEALDSCLHYGKENLHKGLIYINECDVATRISSQPLYHLLETLTLRLC